MKKLMILIPALFLMAGSPLSAKTFSDISETSPYYKSTHYLSQLGVINGYPDGVFKPYDEINRAELLKILLEGAEIETEIPEIHCFLDTPYTEWYAPYVCTAKTLGFVEGYPDGTFKPAQKVNKVEAIKMLGEVYDWTYGAGLAGQPFLDTQPDQWYIPYLQFAKDKNLLPETGNHYKPATNMIRGSMAEILYRYLVISSLNQDIYSEDLEMQIPEKTETKISPLNPTTKQLAEGEIRIILDWETKGPNDPSDLDAHLLIPSAEEIYYMFKLASDLSIIMEVKTDTERLTIRNFQQGGYEFLVNRFTGDKPFQELNATVEIYDQNGLAAYYEAPQGNGKIWKIFEIGPNREIMDVNQIGECGLIKGLSVLCPES